MDSQQLLRQVKTEYEEGQDFLRARKLRQVNQLILLNNLRRGDENISSKMLFTFFNRVFSNLYDDKIQIKFIPGGDEDYKKTEALNKLSVNDYREMDKQQLDYDWLWDTLFFGRGYCETLNFDEERKIMAPTVINPLVFVYDPYFDKPKDWRYYGKWIFLSKGQINKMIKDGSIKGIKSASELPSGAEAEIWNYKTRREQAKEGTSPTIESQSPNQIYQILEFYTHDDNGEKVVVWTDKDFTKLLREKKLSDILKEDDNFPIVIKEGFREPHSSLPVSVPDIVEDEHRALSVLYNLMYIAAKDEANPIYTYIASQVDDPSQLFQRQINQHIPVTDQNAIMPLKKDASVSNSLLQFVNVIKGEGSEAIGATQVAPTIPKGKKTATEAAILQQIADLSQSLMSKVLAIGEREFWSHWYQRYINNLKEGDKKIVTMTSTTRVSFESIRFEDIKTKYPPKTLVLSAKEAEFKEMVERRELAQQFQVISSTVPPESFSKFLKNVYFPKFGTMDSETLDLIFPKSIETIKAEQENEQLNKDILAKISPEDDDEAHLYVHAQAKNTSSKWAHYFAHERQRAIKLQNKMQEQAQQISPPEQGKEPPGEPKDMFSRKEMEVGMIPGGKVVTGK